MASTCDTNGSKLFSSHDPRRNAKRTYTLQRPCPASHRLPDTITVSLFVLVVIGMADASISTSSGSGRVGERTFWIWPFDLSATWACCTVASSLTVWLTWIVGAVAEELCSYFPEVSRQRPITRSYSSTLRRLFTKISMSCCQEFSAVLFLQYRPQQSVRSWRGC